MSRPVDAKTRRAQHEEREFAERYGTPVARAPLTTAPEAPPSIARRAGKGILRWFKTAAITLSVLWALSLAVVLWATSSRMSQRWRPAGLSNRLVATVAGARPGREHRLPIDASITPLAAGEALARLYSTINFAGGPSSNLQDFRLRSIASPPAIPWRGIPLARDLFPTKVVEPQLNTGLPRNPAMLGLARGPLNAQQKAALRMVGGAAVWREFDLVARAASVDMIGGRYNLPFGPNARAIFLPLSYAQGLSEFGYASLMRASWHLSEGRRDSAVFALRALISFGAAIADNGSTWFEAQTGASAALLGSDALALLYQMLGDKRGDALAAARKQAWDAVANSRDPVRQSELLPRGDIAAAEKILIAQINAPETGRGMKLELMRSLERTACASVRGLLSGPSREAKAAIDAARKSFVHLPSDEELLRTFDAEMGKPVPNSQLWGPMGSVANFVGNVYFIPRLGMCSITAAGAFGSVR